MTPAVGRRHFLRLSALTAASVVTTSSCRGQLSRTPTQGVVVVGAGLAGLRAASLLRKAGRQVLVLEARAHPGGRVRTLRAPFDDGLYAEAGAIRIAGAHHSILRSVRDAGLTVVPFASSNGSPLVAVGALVSRSDSLAPANVDLGLNVDERGLSVQALFERYTGDLPGEMADPNTLTSSYSKWRDYDQLTWPEWLRSRGASNGAITLMTLGGDSRELSALYILRQYALLRTSAQFYKIQGGMDLLPRAMASTLGHAVRYNSIVLRVKRDSHRFRIDYTQNGTLNQLVASQVLFAIPFGALRQIEISPPFSTNKERVINNLPYFEATRFLLQSRSRFWRDSRLSGSARTDGPAEVWDCTYDLPGARGILGATAGGEIGRAVLGMSDEECLQEGVGLVARAFPNIHASFEKGVSYRWALDSWSRGAFATFHPGQMSVMMPDISRPEDHIYFAGEHTSNWMGWMEGAFQSGERAAYEIMKETA